MKDLVENAATIRNNRGMLERVEESFRRRLHYCIDSNGGHFALCVMIGDYSDYFMRILRINTLILGDILSLLILGMDNLFEAV
jgi:hypothetical protein